MSYEKSRRGLMLVLSSPSGAGKTTLSKRLLEEEDDIAISVSATTRKPRPGEVDGKDYFFVSKDEFERLINEDELLEYATVFDNSYGTPRIAVMSALQDGKDVLFDIDWQGTQQLSQRNGEDLVRVFILPPSIEELENRLNGRGQDSAETVAKRMAKASSEISHWAEYDYVLINEDLEECLAKIREILHVERMRRRRLPGLVNFVKSLMKN